MQRTAVIDGHTVRSTLNLTEKDQVELLSLYNPDVHVMNDVAGEEAFQAALQQSNSPILANPANFVRIKEYMRVNWFNFDAIDGLKQLVSKISQPNHSAKIFSEEECRNDDLNVVKVKSAVENIEEEIGMLLNQFKDVDLMAMLPPSFPTKAQRERALLDQPAYSPLMQMQSVGDVKEGPKTSPIISPAEKVDTTSPLNSLDDLLTVQQQQSHQIEENISEDDDMMDEDDDNVSVETAESGPLPEDDRIMRSFMRSSIPSHNPMANTGRPPPYASTKYVQQPLQPLVSKTPPSIAVPIPSAPTTNLESIKKILPRGSGEDLRRLAPAMSPPPLFTRPQQHHPGVGRRPAIVPSAPAPIAPKQSKAESLNNEEAIVDSGSRSLTRSPSPLSSLQRPSSAEGTITINNKESAKRIGSKSGTSSANTTSSSSGGSTPRKRGRPRKNPLPPTKE